MKNLSNAKEFESAKQVCDSFSSKDKENPMYLSIKRLRNEIRNDEISDVILKGINMNGTAIEESKYSQLIENVLKRGKVKLGAISLGKSQDGLRTITLADIWDDGEKKTRSL